VDRIADRGAVAENTRQPGVGFKPEPVQVAKSETGWHSEDVYDSQLFNRTFDSRAA
jgi:hypothetical protein